MPSVAGVISSCRRMALCNLRVACQKRRRRRVPGAVIEFITHHMASSPRLAEMPYSRGLRPRTESHHTSSQPAQQVIMSPQKPPAQVDTHHFISGYLVFNRDVDVWGLSCLRGFLLARYYLLGCLRAGVMQFCAWP